METRRFNIRSVFQSLLRKSHAPNPAHKDHKNHRSLALERLEDRCVPVAGSSSFASSVAFNQFTGGAPGVFGFGVDDGEPDRNGDGKSDASGVQKAPNFFGIDDSYSFSLGGLTDAYDPVFGFYVGTYGLQASANIKIKFGVEYSFYVNAGTASLLHDGMFSYDVQEPTSAGQPINVTTSLVTQNGSLFTVSPKVSAYADLIVKLDANASFRTAFVKELPSINLGGSIDQRIPLLAINRQVKDSNGNPTFNSNGSPKFSGEIEIIGDGLLDGLPEEKTAEKMLEDARDESRQGEIDKRAAEMELNRAKTSAERTAAQNKINAAQSKINSGNTKEAAINNKAKGPKKFGAGEIVTVEFGPTTDGLLGVQADVGLGVSAGQASIGKKLGSLALTLPDVGLTDNSQDSNGRLNASTNQFAAGSDEDKARRLAAVTVDVGGIVGGAFGAGTYTASLGPLSAELTTVSYDVTAALNVNQSVDAVPSAGGHKVTFAFTDADTGAAINVNATALALTSFGTIIYPRVQTTGSSITFVPGQKLQITPPAGKRIRISPVLQQSYSFSNDIGLNLDIQGQLRVLGLKGSAFDYGFDTGYLYSPDPNKFLSQNLGSIYKKSFEVKPPAVQLSSFVVGEATSDVQLTMNGSPNNPVLVTAANPNPNLDWTLTVFNNGPLAASGVVVSNVLPAQVAFDSARSTAGVTVLNGVATINIGSLPAGQSRVITIAGRYVTGTGTHFVNSFTASSAATPRDSNSGNNFALSITDLQLPLVFNVTNEAQLRDAINQSNNASGGDIPMIVLSPSSPITLTQGELFVNRSVVITSTGGMATISGDGKSRVFRFAGFGVRSYRLENLIIRRGNGVGFEEGFGGAIQMIDNNDTLWIANSRIEDSTALTVAKSGGGIYVQDGTVTLENVSLTGNKAEFGGGMELQNARATLRFVDVSRNEATKAGGGVDNASLVNGTAQLAIFESHFLDNRAPSGASVANQADVGTATVTYEGSTFATSAGGGSAPPPNFANGAEPGATATITSLGDNIATDGTGNLTATGDQPNTQPGLFLSSLTVGSGAPGFQVGFLSLVWPRVVGAARFRVSDERFLVAGDILKLDDDSMLDANANSTVTITVTATDETGGTVGPSNAMFALQVVRGNHSPTAINVADTAGIAENLSAASEPGVAIAGVSVMDEDANDAFTFFVDDSRFQIKRDGAGYKLYLKPGLALDFEQKSSIPIRITAVDNAGMQFSTLYSVKVIDVAEAPRRIVGGQGIVLAGMEGAVVGTLWTMDPDSDPASQEKKYTYTVSDPRFEVTGDRVLKLKAGQALSASPEPITLSVIATDSNNMSVVETFKVTATAVPPGAGGAIMEFSAVRFEGMEGQSSVVVTLSRSGDLTGPAVVDYTIGVATALPLRNQASLAKDIQGSLTGIVFFAAGELTKTISIAVVNDNLVEDAESFVVTIGNARGGSTGGLVSATVAIADNDMPVVPNAQPPAERLELAGSGFGKSEEHYRDFVIKAYARFLNRAPDAAGLTFWVTLMQQYETSKHTAGLRQEQIEAGFIASPEYVGIYGGVGEAWVRGIYKDLLTRAADENGVQFWMGALASGVTPTNVALGFTSSDERLQNRVKETYRTLLEREADANGLAFWVAIFKQGGTTEDINSGFVGSNEYYNKANRGGGNPAKWTASAYLDILFRAAATNEMDYWLAVLKG